MIMIKWNQHLCYQLVLDKGFVNTIKIAIIKIVVVVVWILFNKKNILQTHVWRKKLKVQFIRIGIVIKAFVPETAKFIVSISSRQKSPFWN